MPSIKKSVAASLAGLPLIVSTSLTQAGDSNEHNPDAPDANGDNQTQITATPDSSGDTPLNDTSAGLLSDIDTQTQFIFNYEEIAGENFKFTPHNGQQAVLTFNDQLSLDLIAEEGSTSILDSRDDSDELNLRRAAITYNFSEATTCSSSLTAGLLGQLREPPTDNWHGQGFDPIWDKGMSFEELNDFAGVNLTTCMQWTPAWRTKLEATIGRKYGDTPDTNLDATIGLLDKHNVPWGANIRDYAAEEAKEPLAELDARARELLDELAKAETPQVDIDDISGEVEGREFIIETDAFEAALQKRLNTIFSDIRQTAENLDPQIRSEVLEAINDIPGSDVEEGIHSVIDFFQAYPEKYEGKVQDVLAKLPEGDARQELAKLNDDILDISNDTTRQLNSREQLSVIAAGLGLDEAKFKQLGIDGVSELMAILRVGRGNTNELSNRLSLTTEWEGDNARFGIGISGGVIHPGPSGEAQEIYTGGHIEGAFDITNTIEYSSILTINYYQNYLNLEGVKYGNYTWGNTLTYDFSKAGSPVHIDGLSVHADMAYMGDVLFGESRYTGVGAKYNIGTGHPTLQIQVHGSLGQIETGQNVFVDEPGLFSRVTGDTTFDTRQLGFAAKYRF